MKLLLALVVMLTLGSGCASDPPQGAAPSMPASASSATGAVPGSAVTSYTEADFLRDVAAAGYKLNTNLSPASFYHNDAQSICDAAKAARSPSERDQILSSLQTIVQSSPETYGTGDINAYMTAVKRTCDLS